MYKDIDAQTGIIETFVKDKIDGKITIHQMQDVEPFIDANKRDMQANGKGFKGDLVKVASIPPICVVILTNLLKAKGCDDTNPISANNRPWLLKILNSPEWRLLRTKTGRL